MHKIKRFFETLFSKKGCANCLHCIENEYHQFICTLPEKDRKDCEACDKTHEPFSHWQKKLD